MHNDIDPKAARKIADDRYVDDITTGGQKRKFQQVPRIQGPCEDLQNKPIYIHTKNATYPYWYPRCLSKTTFHMQNPTNPWNILRNRNKELLPIMGIVKDFGKVFYISIQLRKLALIF